MTPKEELKLARRAVRIAVQALDFYASPETYFAISYLLDHPVGAFMKDFDETHLGKKPGKRARKALAKLAALTKGNADG